MKKKKIRELEIDLGKELIQSLKEFAEALESGDMSKIVVHTYGVPKSAAAKWLVKHAGKHRRR